MPLRRLPADGFELSLLAAQYRSSGLGAWCGELNRTLSMLHPDVLALLYHFGRYAAAPVLELGPYVGGATVAIARGLADAGRGLGVVSVELGGASSHSQYPTRDIVASLRANLAERGLAPHCRLVVGHSREPATVAQVAPHAPFGWLLIDADGQVEEDLALYGRLLQPGALLVVDDYYSPGAPEKEAPTQRALDRLAARGAVEPFGVHGWGTWFGRLL